MRHISDCRENSIYTWTIIDSVLITLILHRQNFILRSYFFSRGH
jgi:hypothetical protein